MTNEPIFKTGEIVRVVSTHPRKRKMFGLCGIVDEVEPHGRGQWRYRLLLLGDEHQYFHENELETTGAFD